MQVARVAPDYPVPSLMHRRRAVGEGITYIGLDVHKEGIVVAVTERGHAAGPVSRAPPVSLAGRQTGGLRRLRHRPAVLRDPFNQEELTLRRQPRILVDVHLGLRPGLLVLGNQQFPSPAADEQPS